MKTEKNNNIETNNEFMTDSTYNIMMGAKVFSEKASDIFSTFLEKVKESAEAAYEKGSEIYENVALTAQAYVDTYKDRGEIAKLKAQKAEVATQLGYMCFMEYSGRYRFRVEFLKSDEFKTLVKQLRELDKEIIKIGERLDSEANA